MSTIPGAFLDRVRRAPDGVFGRLRIEGTWVAQTGRETERRIAVASDQLARLGVQPGDRVAVLGPPHPNWVTCDLAILSLRGVTVGIYPTLPRDQILYLLRHSGAKLLLSHVPMDVGIPCVDWSLTDGAEDVPALHRRVAMVRAQDVATLIYTSGTTGDPKGVVLTHAAFMAVAEASREALPLEPGDSALIFLPLAHSLQRLTLYRGFLEDAEGWFVPRMDEFPEAMRDARPTVLASVPRMLEKMKAKIEGAVAGMPARRQKIFAWAMAVGRRRSQLLEAGAELPLALRAQWAIADRIFTRVRTALGGRLRVFVCGGARLDPEVARFFHAMGITVLEGWGLSETCAPATMNTPKAYRFGTVGRAMPGVSLRLDHDGEVLVRGPGVFSGYWADRAASAEVLSPDGWLRTGDIGTLDADGFLRIVDRKKEILVTSGGKNIPPVNIEKRIEGGAIGQAVVIGDDRPYLVALLAPDPEVPCVDPAGYAAARVAEANAGRATFEQVRRWVWLPGPLAEAEGLITPTLKLKRKAIAARFAAEIAALYEGS